MPHRRLFPLVLVLALLLGVLPGAMAQQPASVHGPAPEQVLVDGALLDYRVLGADKSGTPLLLLTGYAATLDMWDQGMVAALARHRRVILLDNRGMGRAPAPEGAFGIARMAQDAAGLLDALGVRRADVLGWSMGGFTAQELALARPELVRRLVLLATQPDNAGLMPRLDRMAAMGPEEFRASLYPAHWAAANPHVYGRMPGRVRPPDMGVIARQYAAMEQWRGARERLASLRQSTLVLSGAADWVCPPERGEALARGIAQARLVVLPDAGHWLMHQYPEELAGRIGEFLDVREGASAPRRSPAP